MYLVHSDELPPWRKAAASRTVTAIADRNVLRDAIALNPTFDGLLAITPTFAVLLLVGRELGLHPMLKSSLAKGNDRQAGRDSNFGELPCVELFRLIGG